MTTSRREFHAFAAGIKEKYRHPLLKEVGEIASWCAVSELSENSALNRSQTMDIPDFTRGVTPRAT